MGKQKMKERQPGILELIKDFASEKLNDEYVDIAERLMMKLSRKRINPMEIGKPEVWAAGIIHALGTINALFEEGSQPHATVNDINAFFKTTEEATIERSRQIQAILNLCCSSDEFSIHQMLHSNPFSKLVFMNGFLVPLDSLPMELRETIAPRP